MKYKICKNKSYKSVEHQKVVTHILNFIQNKMESHLQRLDNNCSPLWPVIKNLVKEETLDDRQQGGGSRIRRMLMSLEKLMVMLLREFVDKTL